jgi:hypothetical protein
MIMERREIEDMEPRIRNTPMRPRVWRELLESDDIASVGSEVGTILLADQDGQLNLHYAFSGHEEMRHEFSPMFEELTSEIDSFDAEYLRIDLVQVPDRNWIEPLLHAADFRDFGEWIDMVRPDLDPDQPPPEFPKGIAMRRAEPGDADRIVAIEATANGDFSDGEAATRQRLEECFWSGVLERDGELVAYAINGPVERAEARILSAAVAPDAEGESFTRLVIEAALYQLTANEARSAVVRVRPGLPGALKASQALGFSPGMVGVEWRRPADEQAIAARRREEHSRGMKARFGGWR